MKISNVFLVEVSIEELKLSKNISVVYFCPCFQNIKDFLGLDGLV